MVPWYAPNTQATGWLWETQQLVPKNVENAMVYHHYPHILPLKLQQTRPILTIFIDTPITYHIHLVIIPWYIDIYIYPFYIPIFYPQFLWLNRWSSLILCLLVKPGSNLVPQPSNLWRTQLAQRPGLGVATVAGGLRGSAMANFLGGDRVVG
jgi:hypothetical protein